MVRKNQKMPTEGTGEAEKEEQEEELLRDANKEYYDIQETKKKIRYAQSLKPLLWGNYYHGENQRGDFGRRK